MMERSMREALDDHIEGRFDSNNPANMMDCPNYESVLVKFDDEVCWKCKKSINWEVE